MSYCNICIFYDLRSTIHMCAYLFFGMSVQFVWTSRQKFQEIVWSSRLLRMCQGCIKPWQKQISMKIESKWLCFRWFPQKTYMMKMMMAIRKKKHLGTIEQNSSLTSKCQGIFLSSVPMTNEYKPFVISTNHLLYPHQFSKRWLQKKYSPVRIQLLPTLSPSLCRCDIKSEYA